MDETIGFINSLGLPPENADAFKAGIQSLVASVPHIKELCPDRGRSEALKRRIEYLARAVRVALDHPEDDGAIEYVQRRLNLLLGENAPALDLADKKALRIALTRIYGACVRGADYWKSQKRWRWHYTGPQNPDHRSQDHLLNWLAANTAYLFQKHTGRWASAKVHAGLLQCVLDELGPDGEGISAAYRVRAYEDKMRELYGLGWKQPGNG